MLSQRDEVPAAGRVSS